MIWFTADLHLGHKNIIKYCNRPYQDVYAMDFSLITNWNNVVGDKDTVYVLGDFAMDNAGDYLRLLKGNKILLTGDHDKALHKIPNSKQITVVASPAMVIKTGKKKGDRPIYLTLSHYPMRSWCASHYGSWHLFGHEHGTMPAYGKSFDAGVDANAYRPISLDEVEERMSGLKPIVDYSEGT